MWSAASPTSLERNSTTTVNDIEHIEAQSYHGVAVVKIFFQPDANIFGAIAQVTAIAQQAIRGMPPGTTPPQVLQYSAAEVPVLQIGLSSKSLSEQQLQDLGSNFLRTRLSNIQGITIPAPYGGKNRLVTVGIDPQAAFAEGYLGCRRRHA